MQPTARLAAAELPHLCTSTHAISISPVLRRVVPPSLLSCPYHSSLPLSSPLLTSSFFFYIRVQKRNDAGNTGAADVCDSGEGGSGSGSTGGGGGGAGGADKLGSVDTSICGV